MFVPAASVVMAVGFVGLLVWLKRPGTEVRQGRRGRAGAVLARALGPLDRMTTEGASLVTFGCTLVLLGSFAGVAITQNGAFFIGIGIGVAAWGLVMARKPDVATWAQQGARGQTRLGRGLQRVAAPGSFLIPLVDPEALRRHHVHIGVMMVWLGLWMAVLVAVSVLT